MFARHLTFRYVIRYITGSVRCDHLTVHSLDIVKYLRSSRNVYSFNSYPINLLYVYLSMFMSVYFKCALSPCTRVFFTSFTFSVQCTSVNEITRCFSKPYFSQHDRFVEIIYARQFTFGHRQDELSTSTENGSARLVARLHNGNIHGGNVRSIV